MQADRRWWRASLAAALVSVVGSASAQSVDVEAEHQRGVALRAEHRDAEAAEVFRGLYERTGEARALGRLALAEAAAGRWLDAEEHLLRAMTQVSDPWIAQNRASLEQGLRAVQQRLGSLRIQCATPGAEFRVDGRRVTPQGGLVRVVAGTARVEVSAEGHEPFAREVTVAPGTEPQPLEVTLTPVVSPPPRVNVTPPPPPPRVNVTPPPPGVGPWRALAIGAWSLGGAALVLGAVGQGVGWSHANRFDAQCELYATDPVRAARVTDRTHAQSAECVSDYQTANGWLTGSVVSFVVGGALVAAGTALWFAAPRARRAGVTLRCAPGVGGVGVACEGTF